MSDPQQPLPEFEIPRSFRELPRWWTDGTEWLDSLSDRLALACAAWRLFPDGRALHGSNAIALPVTRDGVPLLLRLTPPHPGFALEIEALRFWDGRGTVRLIDHDLEAGAMLLERLDTTRTLADVPLSDAVPVIARLMRRLAVPADDADVSSTAEVVAVRADGLVAQWERLGKPFDRAILEQALGVAQDLSSARRDDAVNGDLHFAQVLAGKRESWLAVDPVLLRGDSEYDLARILWTRLDEMTDDQEVLFHFDSIVREAHLDRARAWKWVVYRSVDYWLWGLDNGLTTDPERCRRLVTIFGGGYDPRELPARPTASPSQGPGPDEACESTS